MIKRISGWGRANFSQTCLEPFANLEQLMGIDNGRGLIPRGLGRSYGDSAANSGGITVETGSLNKIEIDSQSGLSRLGAGVTIGELEKKSLSLGFFPPVVPGTSRVSIGGAIASDIHGKSHHRDGSFSCHVTEIILLTSAGHKITLRPYGSTSNLFWATVGGMGLTGIILEAQIQLKKVENAFVIVQEKRAKNLNQLLDSLIEFDSKYQYTVAWIDLSGKYLGRGLVSGGNHASGSEVRRYVTRSQERGTRSRKFKVPNLFAIRLVNNFTIRAFNLLWFYKPGPKKLQKIEKFMHPLDGIENWNIIYGKYGFIQYQFVVPYERRDVIHLTLEKLHSAKIGSSLTVLKSFGEGSKGLISFPSSGWTLAIDLPAGHHLLSQTLKELDHLVICAGGRVYLTKDSRLTRKSLELMYPKLKDWKDVKVAIDPKNSWQSDQGRRLGLC